MWLDMFDNTTTLTLLSTEYPGASGRGAPATDTPNLTAFFKELRAGIPSAIVSCGMRPQQDLKEISDVSLQPHLLDTGS